MDDPGDGVVTKARRVRNLKSASGQVTQDEGSTEK